MICLVKFVPKVDDFKYDDERNVLIRDGVPLIINPDDACALEFALQTKDRDANVQVEVVCMGPLSLQNRLEDLVRRGADKAILISDKKYVGSDSYATAKILSAYLVKQSYNLILSGSQTLDGDTGHIGPQVAELLGLSQCSNIIQVERLDAAEAVIKVDDDDKVLTLGIRVPALLSISKDSKYKLRFTKAVDKDKDVSEQVFTVNNSELGLDASVIGLKGSPTQVKKTFIVERKPKRAQVVACDDDGIEKVYDFLKAKGVV